MSSILRAENIVKEFGESENRTRVLKEINFELHEGEFGSIMGPSGCGKSTLLYILGGLDKPTSGSVYFADRNIANIRENTMSSIRRRSIGFVFQFYNLVQNLSVEENILLPLIMDGRRVSAYKHDLDEILEIVGLSDKRKFIPSKLSGGQQQRVSIARSIITNPSLLLADEPIGNLDSKSGKEIMSLFERINREKGITILQVTHSDDAAEYGSRIIRLTDGVITEDKPTAKKLSA